MQSSHSRSWPGDGGIDWAGGSAPFIRSPSGTILYMP